MDTENDPSFWEWLKELQDQTREENTFERLVLELPLPRAPKKKPKSRHYDNPEADSPSYTPFSEYDVDTGNTLDEDDSVIFQF